MKALGTRRLAEPSQLKKSASGCPSGLAPPLRSPPTTNVGASGGAPALHFRWATMADRKRRFRSFAEFCTSCLARLRPEPFEHYLPQACPDAVVRLQRRLGPRGPGIFSFAFLAQAFAVLPLPACAPSSHPSLVLL